MINIVKLPPVHTPPPIVHAGGTAIPAALPILGVGGGISKLWNAIWD